MGEWKLGSKFPLGEWKASGLLARTQGVSFSSASKFWPTYTESTRDPHSFHSPISDPLVIVIVAASSRFIFTNSCYYDNELEEKTEGKRHRKAGSPLTMPNQPPSNHSQYTPNGSRMCLESHPNPPVFPGQLSFNPGSHLANIATRPRTSSRRHTGTTRQASQLRMLHGSARSTRSSA
jgi:hypothetical protein